ncbi:hypothetical protein OL229_13865 [Neisseriaceae bacterium JH1-16]|nr:hypothetical protein [Neisseriaceae bacterium JH1-16]
MLPIGYQYAEPRLLGLAGVIVLAGDIGLKHHGVEWAKTLTEHAPNTPIIMVAGNHEFYGGHFDKTLIAMREAAIGSNVHVLENDALLIDDIRFLGCTLWTDLRLYGPGDAMRWSMEEASRCMNDFHRITFSKGQVGYARPSS